MASRISESACNLGVIFDENFNFPLTYYLQPAVHVFTTPRIDGVFAVTLIWRVQKLLANALVSSHHSPWPVDVTELFPQFFCWRLIWLSRHQARLRWGYWRYRSLFDWLITVIQFCVGLQKLTSRSSNVFWTVWLVWSQGHPHLLTVLLGCAPFIGYR